MVNLEHLHVINTICEQGSFQKASEKLHKVRSAVSYTVKQVEEYYSIEIFNRKTYRPELTAEGKILIVKIRQLLKQAGEFETFVNEMKGINETELRLGVSSIFPLDKITDLLSDLKIQFPSTTIHLNIEVASGERLLLDEQVDIAIFGSLNHHNSIDYRLIDTLDIPLLISDQFKSTERQSPDSGIVDDALKWYVTDQHTKKALICKGFGWGRLPYHLVEKEIQNKQLIRLSTQGELNLPMYITKLKNQPLGPVALKIWQYFL